MSLRFRLVLSVITLVVLTLIAADVASYFDLQSSLTQQLDVQLSSSTSAVYHCLEVKIADSEASCLGVYVPSGSYGALFSSTVGAPLKIHFTLPNQKVSSAPSWPSSFASKVEASTAVAYETVPAVSGSDSFRLVEVGIGNGGVLIVAMPMSSLDNTLGQLRLLELIVGVIALLALAGVAWWVIHLELEPLRRIKNTAQEIATGDLSQRVTNPDTRTEVGQLAVSLNEMMAQIESAFTQRSASEARLRQFVADASHELCTPLTSIRGYAELFRRGARSNPEDLG